MALRLNRFSEIEADVGAYRSFVGWKGAVLAEPATLHAGIEGNVFAVLGHDGARFPLYSTDGLIGLYGEAIRGLWMYQLRYTHVSAHLGDGLATARPRIGFTRETLSLRLARQIGAVRVYLGYHYLLHTEPKFPLHSLQVGFYSILPAHWGSFHPFLGSDLRWRNAAEGSNVAVTAGLALVSDLGAPPIRLAWSYLRGHDLRGQFYSERMVKTSLGLEMDL